ncbi:hypothetical protein D3C87_1296590 [compost metagenome]
MGFFLAAEDANRRFHHRFHSRYELGAIGRVAHGRGRQDIDLAHAHHARHQCEALHRLDGLVHIGVRQPPALRDTPPERTGRFFVVERGQGARMALIDHQTNRVGADVENSDRPGALDAPLRGRIGVDAPELCQIQASSLSTMPALPRPDREGLVMK